MTTLIAATAWRLKKPIVIAATLVAIGLAGCETGSNLLSSNSSPGTSPDLTATAAAAPPPAASTIAPQMARVAVAPVIGAPDSIARDLQSQLSSQIEAQRVTVAKASADKSELTLRGYVVSSREKAGAKISYIWDVTDAAGRRVNRISGEEIIPGSANKDPWTAVTPQITQTIASKAATQFTTWLPSYGSSPAVANAAPAAAPVAPAPTPLAAAPAPLAPAGATTAALAPPPATPAVAPAAPPAASQTVAAAAPTAATPAATTGSIDPAAATAAMVPAVTGAPGDGGVSLTSAIQRELSRNGVTLAGAPSAATYKVEGKVSMGTAKEGKQPIQIDWNVKDPKGKSLGTVSQKNQITQGSLDGAWGKTADLAASAAVQGILKLLPQSAQQQAGAVAPKL